jgi:hypothetical protein
MNSLEEGRLKVAVGAEEGWVLRQVWQMVIFAQT